MTPEFVQYGSLMTPPAPFRSLDTRLFGFVAEADGELMDALCERVFAEPTGGEIDVLAIGDKVMLTWGDIRAVNSRTAPYDGYGAVAEPQVVVWVPSAFVRRQADGDPVAQRFAMFVPYIWVDNAMSLATGRELFGYPKAFGQIGMPPADMPSPRRWTLDAYGLDYRSEAIAQMHPLLEVVEGDALEGDGEDPWYDGLADLARHAAGMLYERDGESEHMVPGLRLVAGLASDLVRKRFPHVFLKQMRGIEDGTGAALQQVTECFYEVERIRGRPLLREFTLTVHDISSHPLGAELGLRSQSLNLGYEVQMDFLVGDGRVLWP